MVVAPRFFATPVNEANSRCLQPETTMSVNAQDAGDKKLGDKKIGEAILNETALQTAKFKADQLIKRPEFANCDSEDVQQDLLMYLIERADDYDPSRSQLNTFISRMLDCGVRQLVRSKKRHKRHPIETDQQVESLQRPVPTEDSLPATLADELTESQRKNHRNAELHDPFEEIDRQDAFDMAIDRMPARLRQIAIFMMDHSIAETGREFGLSRRQMNAARVEIEDYLRPCVDDFSDE